MSHHKLNGPVEEYFERVKNGRYDETRKISRDGYNIIFTKEPSGHNKTVVLDKNGHIAYSSSSTYGAPSGTIDEQFHDLLERWPRILADIKQDEKYKEKSVMEAAEYEDVEHTWKKEREQKK